MRIQSLTGAPSIVKTRAGARRDHLGRDGTGARPAERHGDRQLDGWRARPCTTSAAERGAVRVTISTARNVPSVTFAVTGVVRAGYTYTPAANVVTSVQVLRPQ